MMTTVPRVPVPHPIPKVNGKLRTETACAAVPNCVGPGAGNVTGSIGSVTCGADRPKVSVNITRIPVITTADDPVVLTITSSGTLNGATEGQNGLLTGCANAVEDVALTTTDEVPIALGCVVNRRASVSLHDAVRRTAATRTEARA